MMVMDVEGSSLAVFGVAWNLLAAEVVASPMGLGLRV